MESRLKYDFERLFWTRKSNNYLQMKSSQLFSFFDTESGYILCIETLC